MAHSPSIRKKKSDYIPPSLFPPQLNVNIHSIQTAPASTIIVSHNKNIDKRLRFHAMFTRMTNISSSPKKPIPISINNSISSVKLHIGNPEDDENRIRMCVDTGAARNNRSL